MATLVFKYIPGGKVPGSGLGYISDLVREMGISGTNVSRSDDGESIEVNSLFSFEENQKIRIRKKLNDDYLLI